MADPAQMDENELINAISYLGKDVQIPLTGSQNLPSAAAAGAIPAPTMGGTQSANTGQTIGGLSGGGLAPQPGPSLLQEIQSLLGVGTKLTDIGQQLFGGTDTRGTTGGTSLSDQVRSSLGGAGSATPGAVGVLPTPGTEVTLPGSIPGMGVTGETAGGGLSFDFGPAQAGAASALESAAPTAAETAAEVAIPSAAEALTGVATSGIVPLLESFFGVGAFGEGNNAAAKLRETSQIRKDFGSAWPSFADSPNTLGAILAVSQLPPEQQGPALQKLYDAANYQESQIPAISHFTSTHGGAQKGLVKPVDVSGIEQVSPEMQMDAILANTLAADQLAQLGMSPQGGSDFWASPMGPLNELAAQAGVSFAGRGAPTYSNEAGFFTATPTDYQLTPEQAASFAQPGHRMQAIQDLFSSLNPDFANSLLGQRMGVQAPSPATVSPPALPSPAPIQASSTQQAVDSLQTPGGTTEEEQLRKLLGGL